MNHASQHTFGTRGFVSAQGTFSFDFPTMFKPTILYSEMSILLAERYRFYFNEFQRDFSNFLKPHALEDFEFFGGWMLGTIWP